MLKIINNQAPNHLQTSMVRDQHGLNNRFSQYAIIVPHVEHSRTNSVVCIASKLWNSVPPIL